MDQIAEFKYLGKMFIKILKMDRECLRYANTGRMLVVNAWSMFVKGNKNDSVWFCPLCYMNWEVDMPE